MRRTVDRAYAPGMELRPAGLLPLLLRLLPAHLLPFPFNAIPYLEIVGEPYQKLWTALVPWVAKHLFSLDITVFPNGSGDTTYNYVQVFCYLALSLLVTVVLDASRPQAPQLRPAPPLAADLPPLRALDRDHLVRRGQGDPVPVPRPAARPSDAAFRRRLAHGAPMDIHGSLGPYNVFSGAGECSAAC